MARRARALPGALALLLGALLLAPLPLASALASPSRLRAATAAIAALQRSPVELDGHGLPPDKHPLQRWELPWRGAADGAVESGWEADAVWSAPGDAGRLGAADRATAPLVRNASLSSSPSGCSISASETLLARSNALVTVTWSTPQPGYDDIVALYAPAGADARLVTPVKFAWAARSPGHLSSGRASMRLRVPNLRAPVAFALVRGGLGRPRTVAWSEPVRFARFDEPTQGHLVVTGREGEVKVLWVAGNQGGEGEGEGGERDEVGGERGEVGGERGEVGASGAAKGSEPRRGVVARRGAAAELSAEPSAEPRKAPFWRRAFGVRQGEAKAPTAPSRSAERPGRADASGGWSPGGAVQYGPAPPHVARLLSASSAASAPVFFPPRDPPSARSSAPASSPRLPLSRGSLRSLLASVPLPLSSRSATLTYSAADLCGAPATGQGWIDPGVQHAATMRGLEAGTWYVYRYGDQEKGLWSEPQAYFVPPGAIEKGDEGKGAEDGADGVAESGAEAGGDARDAFGRVLAPVSPSAVRILALADLGQVELDGSFEASEMVASAATAAALRRELGLPPVGPEEEEAEENRGEDRGADALRAARGSLSSPSSAPLPPPSLLLLNGDVSYARGYGAIWDRFFEQFQDVFGRVPLATVPGNHERDWPGSGDRFPAVVDSGGECGLPYDVRLAMPMAGDDGGDLGWPKALRDEIRGGRGGISAMAMEGTFAFSSPRGPDRAREAPAASSPASATSPRPDRPWYALDHGPVHLVFYSTEHRFEVGSEQHAWILDDLRRVNRTRTPWLVVNGHRPIYVDSTWDVDRPDADQTMARALREAFEDAFHAFDVDLTLHGHHHSYQRTCPVKGGVCADGREEGAREEVRGKGAKGRRGRAKGEGTAQDAARGDDAGSRDDEERSHALGPFGGDSRSQALGPFGGDSRSSPGLLVEPATGMPAPRALTEREEGGARGARGALGADPTLRRRRSPGAAFSTTVVDKRRGGRKEGAERISDASAPSSASSARNGDGAPTPDPDANLPPVHLVIGHSGAGLTPNVRFFRPAVYRSVELRHGYVRLDANATRMVVETVASFSGELLDRVVFVRD